MQEPMDIDSVPQKEDSDDNAAVRQHNAAQACETCRARKSKCDEERPRCAVCRRLNVVCNYREPKPTKKDKTLVHILDTLKSVESKFDRLESQWREYQSSPVGQYPSIDAHIHRQSTTLRPEREEPNPAGPSSFPNGEEPKVTTRDWQFSPASLPAPPSNSYHHKIEARKLLTWPAVHTLLQDKFSQVLTWDWENDGGEKWLTHISIGCEKPLPTDEFVNFSRLSSSPAQPWDSRPTNLTREVIEDLCEAFFDSFHAMYPILDRGQFYSDTLPKAFSSSFDPDNGRSALVLLVLALGAVARDGASGKSILEGSTGRRTGIRGGSPLRPPGLAFWNEACRRLGGTISQYDLNMLQSFILLSLYYSQCLRNKDYWHVATISCALCSNIVRTVDEWKSFDGDAVARSFWMCILLEGGLVSQLGLSPTGIMELENSVPLPLFLDNTRLEKSSSDKNLFIEYQFLAQITLLSLINRIQSSLRYYANPFQLDGFHDFPPKLLILELARQLIVWREHLPSVLNWSDEDSDLGIEISDSSASWQETVLGERVTTLLPNTTIVLQASLRTRYKYAQYLLWRPYIYKVLHFPDSSTVEDIQGCVEAFKACSTWPITFPIFQDQRRLIPHIYEYSHTFFGILVMLHASECNITLKTVMATLEGRDALELSKGYMLGWMRDMQVMHPVARWGWRLLRVLYRDHPLVEDSASWEAALLRSI